MMRIWTQNISHVQRVVQRLDSPHPETHDHGGNGEKYENQSAQTCVNVHKINKSLRKGLHFSTNCADILRTNHCSESPRFYTHAFMIIKLGSGSFRFFVLL